MTKIGCPDDEVWPWDEECHLGQYDGMNETDLLEINKLYCGDGPTTEPPCKNNSDYERHCGEWRNLGYCEHSYVDFMKDKCALACGCPQ